MKKRSVPLGLLALAFFAVHAATYARLGRIENVLWVCNVATTAVGVGLLVPSATMNAVGAYWLTVGLPLWLFDLALGTELQLSTLLPHIGGLIVGYAGIRRLGLPATTWWVATLALPILVAVCRAATSPSENVNLAHGPYAGTHHIVTSHFGQLAITLGGLLAAFVLLQLALPKLGFQKS